MAPVQRSGNSLTPGSLSMWHIWNPVFILRRCDVRFPSLLEGVQCRSAHPVTRRTLKLISIRDWRTHRHLTIVSWQCILSDAGRRENDTKLAELSRLPAKMCCYSMRISQATGPLPRAGAGTWPQRHSRSKLAGFWHPLRQRFGMSGETADCLPPARRYSLPKNGILYPRSLAPIAYGFARGKV